MTMKPDLLLGDAPKADEHIEFSAQDILASLGFEAQRLAAGVAQHAAGAPFPDPRAIQQLLDRMNHLNRVLVKFAGVLAPSGANNIAQGGMTVELN